MKRHYTRLVGLWLVLLCCLMGTELTAQDEAPESHAQTVQRLLDAAYGQGDFSVFDQVFSPDYTRTNSGGAAGSLDGLQTTIATLRAAMPDLTATVTSSVEDDVWTAVHVQFTGTFEGGLVNGPDTIRPTGVPVSWTMISLLRFDENGLIVDQADEWDRQSLIDQLNRRVVVEGARAAQPASAAQGASSANSAQAAEANAPQQPLNLPAEATPDATPEALPSEQQALTSNAVFRLADAMNTGVFPPELLADDFVLHAPTGDVGAEQLVSLTTLTRGAMPDADFSMMTSVVEGELGAFRTQVSGTFTSALDAIAPTNEAVLLTANVIVRVNGDGQIAEAWAAFDQNELRTQLGLLP